MHIADIHARVALVKTLERKGDWEAADQERSNLVWEVVKDLAIDGAKAVEKARALLGAAP